MLVVGDAPDDYFADTLAQADVTGDGLPDLVVGAPSVFGTHLVDGGVYVLDLASQRLAGDGVATRVTSVLLDGASGEDRSAGGSLEAGDVTGDGSPDLVVDLGPKVIGAERLVVVPGPVAVGAHCLDDVTRYNVYTLSGWSMEYDLSIEDVDGNEASDLLVGSYASHDHYDGETFEGAVYLVTDPIVEDGVLLDMASSVFYGTYGRVVSAGSSVGAADIDGDGLADVGIGIPSGDYPLYPGQLYGVVSVFLGEVPQGFVDVMEGDLLLHGERMAGAGDSLSLDGDFDGDGRLDLAIGGTGFPGRNKGEAWVASTPPPGSHSLPEIAFAHIQGNYAGAFALDLDRAGDLDDDGFDDLVVSGWGGMISLYYGPLQGSYLQDRPNAFKVWYSTAMEPLGDLDGDGFDDLAVGDYGYPGDNRGALYILYGGLE